MTSKSDKNSTRAGMRIRRKELTSLPPMVSGSKISKIILSSGLLDRHARVAAYCADEGEPDISELMELVIERKMPLLLPKTKGPKNELRCEMIRVGNLRTELEPGKFGILEPIAGRPEADLDAADILWLIPGVAFDTSGGRIGRGGGVYDRLLASVKGSKIGVCHQWQLLEQLPQGEMDVAMDAVVTEYAINWFNKK